MAVNDVWTVRVKSVLNIRSGPGTSNPVIGNLENGTEVTEISQKMVGSSLWIEHSRGGWSNAYSASQTYMEMTKAANKVTVVEEVTDNSATDIESGYTDDTGFGYQPSSDLIVSNANRNVSDSEFVKIKNVLGVFGLPYQFLPQTDLRLSPSGTDIDGCIATDSLGYEYASKIVEKIPLLFLSPGKASFMTKYSKSNKESVMERILTSDRYNGYNINSSNLSDLLDSDGRYYTFEHDTTRYYKFVNPMCRIAARYLGIDGIEINGKQLDRMNWEQYTKSGYSSIMDLAEYTAIPFYLDSDTSISESHSNSTTQSTISSTVNSISDMGRELNFLLGYGVGFDTDKILKDESVLQSMENVSNLVGSLLGNGSFFSNIGQHLTTVASGGKLIFPEIWSDSSYSRSYSCKFKLISPDPSKLSIYLNIFVPLFHLLGLVAPQSVPNNPNGYTNPFLVRAVYKGFFNVDMGIITDMSVTKGAECQWTPDGLPTSVEVDISIKDLYQALTITATENTRDWKYDTLNNTSLMDYIANLCGINIFKPEIGRMIDMWFVNNFTNRIEDFFEVDIWAGIGQQIQNLIGRIYR